MRRSNATALSCLVGTALLMSGLSPARAAEDGAGGESSSVVVGGFGLGDGLEASIDEDEGALAFGLPAGGVNLSWDSRAIGVDRHGLGAGWALGIGAVQVEGGVWVYPASGGAFPAAAASPSGLAGYVSADVRFEQMPGELPARASRERAPLTYAYVLHELGGTTTYFDVAGDPVAQIAATGGRTDWVWAPGSRHRLTQVIDPDGVVTSLDWDEQNDAVLVRRGSNLPGGGEPWTIRLDHGRVAGTTDPTGGRVEVTTGGAGVVTGVSGMSGSRTVIDWQPHTDGVLRVEHLVTSGTDGAAWSTRSWRPAGVALPTGWPLAEARGPAATAEMSAAPNAGHTTVVGDGETEVESTYNAWGSLIERVTTGTTGSGRRVLQAQTFRYPATDDDGAPTARAGDLPKAWSRPSQATISFRDERGRQRSGMQLTEFDDFGRLTAQTGVDGVTTTYTYDSHPASESDAGVPPVGLQTSERRVSPEGLVEEVRHQLNEAGTAVVATTQYSGRVDSELRVTGRTEYTVDPDGFVSERREYPAEVASDGAGPAGGPDAVGPRRTRWARTVDLAEGSATVTETVAAGTATAVSVASTVSLTHGGVLAETSATGKRSSTSYDRLGRVVSVSDESGRTTTTAYETARGDGRNAVTVTGPDGVATTELRDEFGRVERVTDNIRDGRVEPGYERVVESREYPAPGLVRSTNAWGAVTAKRVDVFGRTVELTAPTGLRTVTEHDDVAGTVTSGVTPSGRLADAATTSMTTMDAAGRAVGSAGTRSDGEQIPEVSTAYDGFGRPVDSAGGPIEITMTYDEHGFATDQTFMPTSDADRNAGAIEVTQDFDGFGTTTQKTLSDGTASYAGVARTSDLLGRTVSATDQAGVTTTTTHTPDGLVASTITSTGQQSAFEYDETTRELLSSVRSTPGRQPVTTQTERDPVTGAVTAVFDPADRRGTELSYTYDAFGNTRSVTYPDGKQIVHEYDEHGRREATTDITGNTTRYTHDQAGLLTAATQTAADGTVLASVEYSYDAYGRMAEAVRGNGLTTAYAYNAVSDLTRETTTLHGDVTADRGYTYDATGRLTKRVDRARDTDTDGGGAGQPLTATTTTYVYDGFDRLTGSTVHDGDSTDAPATTTTGYTVTVAGDIADETVTTDPGTPDELTTVRAFEYTASGALTAITTTDANGTTQAAQEYDADGNLLLDVDGTTFSYDAANRVTTRTTADGASTRTSYWADGTRRALTTTKSAGASGATGGDASTGFYWDGDTLLNDTHTGTGTGTGTGMDDAGTGSYLIGAIRHARTITSGDADEALHATSYLGTDRHGNTTDLTDQHGTLTARYAYTDYGVTTINTQVRDDEASTAGKASAVGDATRNPFQYAAGHTDPSGDQHLSTRVYNADTMRFTTADPAPMLTNYAFGGLNPVMNVDPSGRSEIGDYLINGVLIGAALITGLFTATSIGLPTGGMSVGAYAAWAVGMFSVIGDVASTGIALAEIVHDAGSRFMNDDQREILRISGIVIGAVAAVTGPIAGGIARRFAAEDENSLALAARDVPSRFDTSPVRPHQLKGLIPAQMSRLFSRKFQFHIETISDRYSANKTHLSQVAKLFMPDAMLTQSEVYSSWVTNANGFHYYFSSITARARSEVKQGLAGASTARESVDAAIKAIHEDRETIDRAIQKWFTNQRPAAQPRRDSVTLFPDE
jgi:RHS repeat-associated protein